MDASKHIDQKLASLQDWRGDFLRSLRKIILGVDPNIVEEWKWMGTPVWNRDGIICLANAHKSVVKVTFHKGAKLPDPQHVFNAGLDGGTWRSLDLSEGDTLDVEGFKGLVRAAIALNSATPAGRRATAATSVTAKKSGANTKPVVKKQSAAKKPKPKTKTKPKTKPKTKQ